MKSLTIDQARSTKIFWLAVLALVPIVLSTTKQADPGVVAVALLLLMASLLPLYFWIRRWSHGLPLWPVFCLIQGTLAALPMLQSPDTLIDYSLQQIAVGGATYLGFVLLGTAIWLALTANPPTVTARLLMIENRHAVRYMMVFVSVGLLFLINQHLALVSWSGAIMAVIRGVAISLNTMGLFTLAYYSGKGLLTGAGNVMFWCLAILTLILSAAGLTLAGALVPIGVLLLGHSLASNRIPWLPMGAMVSLLAILHAGKFEMRAQYWGPEGAQLTLESLPTFYMNWIAFGWGNLFSSQEALNDDDAPGSLLERAGNLHMLLLVQKKSPEEVPFFFGRTYEVIPRLLIPRILNQSKGYSHEGNVMLSVGYGLQSLEQVQHTSIGWGLLAEAYANFGYAGIAGLSILLACFYSFMSRITTAVPLTSLRFVAGLLVMASALKADTMAIFVTSQFQGLIGLCLASFWIMKVRPNPFSPATSGNRLVGAVATPGRGVLRLPAGTSRFGQPPIAPMAAIGKTSRPT